MPEPGGIVLILEFSYCFDAAASGMVVACTERMVISNEELSPPLPYQ